MISKELRKMLDKFIEWIELKRLKSFYPKDVAERFKLNEEDAKQLIRLAISEVTEFKLKKMRDWKVLVLH